MEIPLPVLLVLVFVGGLAAAAAVFYIVKIAVREELDERGLGRRRR